jgi:hypothetical protein
MDVATNRPRPGDTVTAPDARIHRIVERLLSQAQQQGRLPACVLQRVGRFPCGNTADYVGPVLLRTHGGHQLEVVVKIDGSPELAREAALLRRAVDDQHLPQRLRDGLPAVFAIDTDGPDYAYLMEYFDGYRRLSEYVTEPALQSHAHAAIRQMWSILSETYHQTLTASHRPNIEKQYLALTASRLATVSKHESLLATDRPLRVVVDDNATDLPPWPVILDQARKTAHDVTPGFSTFVLGSPHLDNVLARSVAGGLQIKFIDPEGSDSGDWLFDIVKMSQALANTATLHANPQPRIRDLGDRLQIAYAAPVHPAVHDADRLILSLAETFARAHDDDSWSQRHELGVAAKLIRTGARLLDTRTDPRRHLGIYAVVDGLRRLWTASTAD